MADTISQINIPGVRRLKSGKFREIFDLGTLDSDLTPPVPVLPDNVIRKTTEKRLEVLTRLTA